MWRAEDRLLLQGSGAAREEYAGRSAPVSDGTPTRFAPVPCFGDTPPPNMRPMDVRRSPAGGRGGSEPNPRPSDGGSGRSESALGSREEDRRGRRRKRSEERSSPATARSSGSFEQALSSAERESASKKHRHRRHRSTSPKKGARRDSGRSVTASEDQGSDASSIFGPTSDGSSFAGFGASRDSLEIESCAGSCRSSSEESARERKSSSSKRKRDLAGSSARGADGTSSKGDMSPGASEPSRGTQGALPPLQGIVPAPRGVLPPLASLLLPPRRLLCRRQDANLPPSPGPLQTALLLRLRDLQPGVIGVGHQGVAGRSPLRAILTTFAVHTPRALCLRHRHGILKTALFAAVF